MKKAQLHINKKNKKGFSLVEILISFGIFLLFVTAVINVVFDSSKQIKQSVHTERSAYLAEEALEAIRNIRDVNFDNLIDGTYGLEVLDSKWNLSNSPDIIDNFFTRQIEISTISPDQKRVDVTISWNNQNSLNNEFVLSTYLTNWKKINPLAGITLKKVIIDYFDSKNVNDFAPYQAEATIGTSTVNVIFETGTAIEDPIKTYTFETLDVETGTYTISETPDSNYTATFSGDCDISGVVELLFGDSKTCTITNEQKYATLTVNKVVQNDNGAKTASDFAPFLIDSNTIIEGAPTKFLPGTYTISETTDPNYDVTFSGDCNSSGVVTLSFGDNKQCTITNTFTEIPVQETFIVTIQNINNYRINGSLDPLITLQQGKRYVFQIDTVGQPFWIKTGRATKVTGVANAYNNGVQNNGIESGQIIFDVPIGAPLNNLYYISQNRSQMSGNIDTTP